MSYNSDPLLYWDTVSAVELYNSDLGAWVTVTAPATGWMNNTGFSGHTLTAEERASTTGMRLTVVPNTTARTAAADNAMAPPVNSGIATSTSGSVRTIPLLWELRNTLRVPSGDSKWVEAETALNADKGAVENTVLVTGTRGDKTSSNTDKDTISLTNSTPAVKVSKVADKKTNVLPNLTDATPADFPVVTYTMKAANTAGSSASYLRLTDPCAVASKCATGPTEWNANVFAGATYDENNPFERMTLTGITFPDASQMADRDASQVLLWDRAEDGTLSTRAPLSINAAEALTPAQLTTVVGASVLFQGTDPARDGGKLKAGNLATDTVAESNVLGMTLVTQVRAYERTSGAVVTPDSVNKSNINNVVHSQSYDPVLAPENTPTSVENESVKVVSGELKIATTKTISPSSLTEVQRHTPLTLTLAANDNNSTVSTGKVVVEDSTEEFWNTYRLTGFNPAQVTLPAGADRVQVDLRTGTAKDATWHNGTAAAAAALPAGVELDAVTGIRFTFTKLNAVAFSRTTPPASWNTNIVLPLALRDVTLAGEEIVFAGSIDNVITAETSRNDNPLIYPSKDAKNEASISLGLGTHSLDVSKAPAQQTVQVDADNLWTLTFTNSRNSYLNITELVDIMPATLKWDEEEPTFSTSEGGTLSTDVVTRLDRETNTLHFTWPEGANRMAPGEKFTVTMNMPLQPGLEPNGKAINQMVVTTAQQLDSCTNTSVPTEGKIPNLPGNQCGTTNYVQQSTGGLFQLYKTVKGELRENAEDKLVSGATNKIPGRDCVADADGFFGPECAANTVVGGTDAWRLRIANTGDQAISSATIVDVLPATGDRTLVAGTSRESTFRPLFDGAHGVQLLGNLAGAKMTWQVTTGTSVCTGPNSGSTWRANPTCEASTWIDSDKFNLAEESDSITAIRVKYDFSGMTGGGLAPNASASVDFQTINVPRSDAFSDGAPVVAPVDGVVAWNQAGALANFVNNESLTRAPKVVGVRIQTGALAIAKQMVGEAAELYAPGFAGAAVQCRVPSGLLAEDGTPAFAKLTMPGNGSYGLNTENEFARTITGLPLGALCDVTEAGERGLYGETRRGGGAQNVIIVNNEVTDLAPIVLENTYDFSNLKIVKQVDSLAQGVNFGTFSFSLQCTAAVSGVPVLWDGEDRLDFTLLDGEEKIVDRIPAGASCELTETDNSLANETRMVVNGVDVHAPRLLAAEEEGSEEPETAAPVSATFTVNPLDEDSKNDAANTAVVHNVYATGTLSVFKNVAGSGADVFGNGPFTAAITCTYGDQELYANGSFAITGGESTLVTSEQEPEGVQFPYGTVCGVTEVKTGGANHTENPDAITIGEAASTVDITNYFEVGSLELIKERTGSGVEKFGNDDYTAAVTCTWQRDGETMTVALPNSGVVVLSASQDYRATIEGILVGAECAVTETDAGLAVATAYSPEDGIVTILDPETEQEPAQVIITNTFLTGSLEITKTVASPMASLGEPVNYTILVRNTGEIEAKNVPVTDTLPAGATLVSAPGATAANGVLTWTIDALEPGAEKSFSVTVTYAAAGEMVNCASLTTPVGPWDKTTVKNPGTDPESSCATVQILPLPALAGGLPSTGGTFLQLGGLALALMLAGLLIARRNRREELGSNA
ncbi:DUF5979 domain-containing protein [Mycetocola spongiae]|uniref:DUF5979 domain-containing protein n=1 Tax=Mycetocola spongiae TaxID=2859226 RepID=UPI001CF5B6FC|nr:DUF5979 domain-containing protein [Mycetocola spongiae]UCR88106.1 DUF11 domain-containing protein [Mycetocola spongiae]